MSGCVTSQDCTKSEEIIFTAQLSTYFPLDASNDLMCACLLDFVVSFSGIYRGFLVIPFTGSSIYVHVDVLLLSLFSIFLLCSVQATSTIFYGMSLVIWCRNASGAFASPAPLLFFFFF